jgi:glycosyltransferase involved in cell wall biosynthesis
MLAPKRTVWQCNEPPMKVDPAHIKSIGLFEYLLSFIYNNPADKKLVARIPEISVLDGMNRDRVRKQYGRDSRVIYIGIEEDYFRTAGSSRAVILKKHGLSVGDAHLICAGNFVPGKNQKLLVRMMGILKSRGIKRVKLILVGRGPDREMLGEMAKSAGVDASVYFAGFLTNENLRELYSASDINLFPAVNQSWGLTPFEAAAQGIPSVVSKDCGTAEVIKKYGIGVLAEPEAGDFAEAVTGLLRFPARIKKLGMKARAFVRRNMHWKNYGEEMIKIFKKINGPGDKNG